MKDVDVEKIEKECEEFRKNFKLRTLIDTKDEDNRYRI